MRAMEGDRTDGVAAYDAQAGALAAAYEGADPGVLRASFSDLLPDGAGLLALDVGAGSGRDAAWLAGRGFDVVAVEPAAGMRSVARSLHPEEAIRWVDDRLPTLDRVHALGLSFDLILSPPSGSTSRPAIGHAPFARPSRS